MPLLLNKNTSHNALSARFRALRAISAGVLLAAVLVVIAIGAFVYRAYNQAVATKEAILILESSAKDIGVNADTLERVRHAWQEKQNAPPPSIARDPFSSATSTAP